MAADHASLGAKKTSMLTTVTIWLVYIFLGGLLLQFYAQTFVTYQLDIDITWIRARKEILLVILGAIVILLLSRTHQRKQLLYHRSFMIIVGGLLATVILSMVASLLLNHQPLRQYIISFKYNLIPLGILTLFYLTALLVPEDRLQKVITRYVLIIKWMLFFALIQRCLLSFKPGFMRRFGFSTTVFEGNVDGQPPAVYYTRLWYGLVRNTFLFERPTTWGFFLTAFRPLFYYYAIFRQKLSETRLRWILYPLNIIITFSRAARGVRIIQTLIITALVYRHRLRQMLFTVILPSVLVVGGFLVYARTHIATREFSNTGHIVMLVKGVSLWMKHPLYGAGAALAGPGSHQVATKLADPAIAFNPENQFLQIFIEYGLIGGLPWLFVYLYLHYLSRRAGLSLRFATPLSKKISSGPTHVRLMVMMGLGVLGLSIAGMVLHSLGDRMVAYPFFALYGIVIALWCRSEHMRS